MKRYGLPRHLVLLLDSANLALLVQTLRQTLIRSGRIQALVLLGKDLLLCQQLAQMWQAVEATVAASFTPGESLLLHQQQLQVKVGQAIETQAGLLILSADLSLWIEITDRSPELLTANHKYEISLSLDPGTIVALLQHPEITALLPHCSGLTTADLHCDRELLNQFWLRMLHLLSSPLEMVPAAPTRPRSKRSGPAIPPIIPNLKPPDHANPLAQHPELIEIVTQAAPIGILYSALDGGILGANTIFCEQLGYSEAQLRRLDLQTISHPLDFAIELRHIQQLCTGTVHPHSLRKRFVRRDGSILLTEVTLLLLGDRQAEDCCLLSFVQDLSDRQQAEQQIQQLKEREALLNEISAIIRTPLDLPTLFQTVTRRLKQVLDTDRVLAYQVMADGSGTCVAETVNAAYPAMLGQGYPAECIPPPFLDAYRMGRLWAVTDVQTHPLADCHREMLRQVQVRSMIAVAVMRTDDLSARSERHLWGLLVVHHCRTPRTWTEGEQQLVQAIANQMAIAIEQTSLVQQLQAYAQELEDRVSQRTQSLEKALRFEQLIRSLTAMLLKVPDVDQVLQTAVQGIVQTLNVEGGYAALFDDQHRQLTLHCQYFPNPSHPGSTLIPQFLDWQHWSPQCRHQVLNGLVAVQEVQISPVTDQVIRIACSCNADPAVPKPTEAETITQLIGPILDDQGVLGALFILDRPSRQFTSSELKLVEQVANQCAIAIRQAQLYHEEHQQRASAEYFRLFLEQSKDVFVEYDSNLCYTSINPAGSALLGLPATEIMGRTNGELIGSAASAIEPLIQQAFVTGQPVFVDHEIPLPTGAKLFETIYTPIAGPDGMVQRVIGVCRDISEFRQQWQLLEHQNQQLAETSRFKEEFIATTSHELRTPLTAILGFSNVLLQEFFGALNQKQRDYLERIHGSGQHLLELINDILDLSRIEANRLDLEPQLIFIEDICEGVLSLIQERAEHQGLQLEVDIEPGLDYLVADPRRLKQMLLNLLTNAVKFTPEGMIGLKIYRSAVTNHTDAKIHFLVWDTGVGISELDQRRLFSPFSQIDSSLSRRHQGTGLGLVITQKLAELHGGTVTLESKVGQGSHFTLSLPLYQTPTEFFHASS